MKIKTSELTGRTLQREEKNTKVRLRGAKTQLQFLENDIKRIQSQ